MDFDLSVLLAMAPNSVISGESAKSLLKFLDHRHPIHETKLAKWTEIGDVLYDRVGEKKKTYIHTSHGEDPNDYAARLKFARFKGELAGSINRIVGAVFKTPPSRPEKLTSKWGDLIDNVDGSKTHLDSFLEDRLFDAIGFGADVVLIDRPPQDADGKSTELTSIGFKAEPVNRQVPPDELIFHHYRISQLVDWDSDATGEPHWIKLVEEHNRAPVPGKQAEKVKVYRIFDRGTWIVLEITKDSKSDRAVKVCGHGQHNLGIVPIAILWMKKDAKMSFASQSASAHHHDIEAFQSDADLRYDSWLHAHPSVKDGRTSEEEAKFNTGPHAINKVNTQQNETLDYMIFPPEPIEVLRQNRDDSQAGIKKSIGIDPLGGTDDPNAMQASGRSKQMSFSISEERFLRRWARALSVLESRIWEVGARWTADDSQELLAPTEKVNDLGKATYPQAFSQDSTDDMIAQWDTTRDQINSETYDRIMQEKIVIATMGDVSEEQREEVLKQIKDNPIINGSATPLGAPGSFLEQPDLDTDLEDAEDALDQVTGADLE